MKYRLICRPLALRQLTDAYLAARDEGIGQEFSEATDRVEKTLARDPASAGESRTEDTRILFDRPLGVVFEINEADRAVFVASARLVLKRK